ncbi:hypothetical protein AQUCO_02800247v1 [Aquilegia coerulea]|uniref:Yippee domain-containing protein n=1 Tax=Aquilegia coerulea TaxID=218851 RepID=A0A2G5D4G4_AQUCA|nr:hypothetical protein AQUCO_02800247v1 [Aquilegia coerulea]
MGRLFIESISSTMVYKCKCCRVDLTSSGQIIDKNFQSKSGKAYLFNKVVNITLGSCEDRSFVTGLHTVKAYADSQKFKEGKYILEKARLLKDGW